MEKKPDHDEECADYSPAEIEKLRAKYEAQLSSEGMPEELETIHEGLGKIGTSVVGFEQEFEAVRDMQNLTDDEVEQENTWGDPVEAKDGLPPCIRLKIQRENEYGVKPVEESDEE